MAITDEELYVHCRDCDSEVATGIRRTERGLAADAPGERAIRCHRCGAVHEYGDSDWYHRGAVPDA
mgnify:CR=1 FL=1